MKKLFTIILLILLTSNLFAQSEYYSTDGKNRMTKSELEEMKQELTERVSKIFSEKVFVAIEVDETFKSGDSIINRISYNFIAETVKKLRDENILYGMKGQVFPKFELTSISGESLALENLIGKPTMINFWFTGCAPCIDEMPILNKMANKFGDKINFIAITYESNKTVKKFLEKHPFDFFHLVDAGSFTKRLGIKTYPTNIFLDSNGTIMKIEGGITYVTDESGAMKMGNGEDIIKILESLE